MEPLDLACSYVSLGRRQGKTLLLVKSLPTTESIVLVTSHEMGRLIKNMIVEYRPDIDPKNVTFIVTRDGRDSWKKSPSFIGMRKLPVYIDNAVIDNMLIGAFIDANEYAAI